MTIRYLTAVAVAVAMTTPFTGGIASAHPDGSAVTTVFDQPVVNLVGKSLVAQEVMYPPGAADPSHRHAGSAFIMAYVLSGAIRSQVAGQPARVYQAGETWAEVPGAHHVVSENASETEPARLLAVFVVDSTQTPSLTSFDPEAGASS